MDVVNNIYFSSGRPAAAWAAVHCPEKRIRLDPAVPAGPVHHPPGPGPPPGQPPEEVLRLCHHQNTR